MRSTTVARSVERIAEPPEPSAVIECSRGEPLTERPHSGIFQGHGLSPDSSLPPSLFCRIAGRAGPYSAAVCLTHRRDPEPLRTSGLPGVPTLPRARLGIPSSHPRCAGSRTSTSGTTLGIAIRTRAPSQSPGRGVPGSVGGRATRVTVSRLLSAFPCSFLSSLSTPRGYTACLTREQEASEEPRGFGGTGEAWLPHRDPPIRSTAVTIPWPSI
jgi:hypothetical protein